MQAFFGLIYTKWLFTRWLSIFFSLEKNLHCASIYQLCDSLVLGSSCTWSNNNDNKWECIKHNVSAKDIWKSRVLLGWSSVNFLLSLSSFLLILSFHIIFIAGLVAVFLSTGERVMLRLVTLWLVFYCQSSLFIILIISFYSSMGGNPQKHKCPHLLC